MDEDITTILLGCLTFHVTFVICRKRRLAMFRPQRRDARSQTEEEKEAQVLAQKSVLVHDAFLSRRISVDNHSQTVRIMILDSVVHSGHYVPRLQGNICQYRHNFIVLFTKIALFGVIVFS